MHTPQLLSPSATLWVNAVELDQDSDSVSSITGIDDESWGSGNVQLTLLSKCVPSSGESPCAPICARWSDEDRDWALLPSEATLTTPQQQQQASDGVVECALDRPGTYALVNDPNPAENVGPGTDTPTASAKSSADIMPIIIGVAVGVLVMVAGLAAFVWWRRKVALRGKDAHVHNPQNAGATDECATFEFEAHQQGEVAVLTV